MKCNVPKLLIGDAALLGHVAYAHCKLYFRPGIIQSPDDLQAPGLLCPRLVWGLFLALFGVTKTPCCLLQAHGPRRNLRRCEPAVAFE